jgi:DNA-binding NtrC family response regulator
MVDGSVCDEIILLVSGINMPGMSGLTLLPEVNEPRPGPVFGEVDTAAKALECGADEFLTEARNFARLRQGNIAVKADALRRKT